MFLLMVNYFNGISTLLTVIGIASSLSSNIAISKGEIRSFGILIKDGAPIDICKARAPTIRAFSNLVYFFKFIHHIL